MKYLRLTCIFIFFACLAAVGQVNQIWYKKGKVLYAVPVAGIDSVTYGQFVSADTFLIVIDRASRRIVYDTVDVHMPGMVYHDTIHTTHTVHLKPGRRIGVFSVAKDKQVSFSQGNLQYVQNQNVWKFADQQYEMIGARNVKDGQLANKIDLFGWSANNTTAPFGVSTSTDVADYAGEFVDWGVNEINGEAPNTWRTLSKDEWEYLFEKRKNAQKLYGVAQVNGSNGIIILPDNWSFDNGISFKTGLHSVETDDYSIFQSFTDQEFSVLESFGAVFIHASGWREGISIEKSQRSGYYWSSTPYNNTDAYRMTFYSYYLKPCDIHYKYRGRSVRLVHDTIVPKLSKRIGVFSVAKDRQVSFSQGNLQYVQNQNVWKFADQQYEYIGADNVKDGELANKIDLFGWSANNTTAPFGVSASTKAADYSGDFVDWGVNEINIDAPNTWRTLSIDEWMYLYHGRKNADKLFAMGIVNGVTGMILFPDDWQLPIGVTCKLPTENGLLWDDNYNGGGYINTNTKIDYYQDNIYSLGQWREMENAGAVFLPAAGFRENANWSSESINPPSDFVGSYATSTLSDKSNYYFMRFIHREVRKYAHSLHRGRAVRLVHDTIVPPPAPCETFEVNGVKFNMMCVEGGTFMMGAGSDAHQVTLSDYYIGETEVTQSLWLAVMGGELPPRQEIIGDEYPVADITMEDCRRFVERLTELTGRHFRIPTEAEWEYAARGGKKSKGYKYSGSDDITEVAWYNGNSTEYRPQIVKQYKPNELGIYDMSGNVCEWVNDWYAPYNLYPQINPTGASIYSNSKLPHIHRGGCWTYAPAQCQPECRTSWSHKSANGIGLRIVMSDEEPFREVYVNDTIRFYLRLVEGGTFMMGASDDDAEAEADEKPQHEVTLSDYYIGQTEVTQQLWEAVMGTNPSSIKGDNLPIESVSWNECQQFVQKLSEMTGLHFRLPTEAEWEYAARGGNRSKGYIYAGSNNADSVAWHPNNCSGLQSVGQKIPNELGLYDMSGNLYEWCSDWYGVYSSEPQINPQGATSSHDNYHIVRGGCWQSQKAGKDGIYYCGVTNRGYAKNASVNIGFRIVLDERPLPPTMPEYVDLGLSVKWATFNIGATAPEESGDYFAWGEVEPKDIYSWATYKLCNGTSSSLTKYCSDSNYGNADYKTTLDPEDDAAYVNWGGNWRMPTEAEWIELRQKCTWKKTTVNGVTGYRVTAKNGNSIFLPRAGLRMNKVEYATDSVGYYASSTHIPNFKKEDYAYYMLMYNNAIERSSAVRYYGLTIRPVYDDVPDPCMVVKVNDTLSINMMCVKGGTFMMGASDDDKKADKDERPQHQVTLTYDYHIMQTEVTQGLWEAVMGEDIYDLRAKSRSPEEEIKFVGGDYPVFYVRFSQCLEFIERLNELTGLHFRMPSEAEWEYAARGGHLSKGYLYSGSNDANEVAAIGYVAATGYAFKPVASLRPNELGIYDMSGNIAEMTLDFAHGVSAPYPSAEPQINPRQISPIKEYAGNRMFRNSHPRVADSVRVTQRYPYTPTWCGNWMGFRLVLAEDYDFKTILVNNVAFEMSFVEGGTFTMGDDSSNNTSPAHQVTLSDYYIGQTEVTQALWKAVMGTNPSNQNDDPYKPVGHVSWDDAQLFVEKLSNKTGLNFRLPTEAEWEYAAMGGKLSQGYKYPGSDSIDMVAWYGVNSDNKLHVVGTKMPNELGIYDMSGNMWEWVSDWYGNYSAEEQINPQGPSSGTNRVLRSGSYVTQAARCAIKYRQARQADHPDVHIGFRIVLDSEPHTYVDLGLSVLWATCNVGAESPEDYGDYFAWGEVDPKDIYSWATYKLCNGTSSSLTKYCSDSNYGKADYKITIETEDDAAYVNWGGDWRMPTETEWTELRQKCTWHKTTINGVTSYRVTAKNGNSIFLPRAGLRMNKVEYAVDSVGYYASILHIPNFQKEDYAYYMLMYNNAIERSSAVRYYGLTIRPVYDAPKDK